MTDYDLQNFFTEKIKKLLQFLPFVSQLTALASVSLTVSVLLTNSNPSLNAGEAEVLAAVFSQ